MNKLLKGIFLVIIILFLSLYFSKYTSDYYTSNNNLTEEAIERYEKDLKEGKEIDPRNYVQEEKNYNNKVSKLGLKTSKLIEKTFNKGLSFLARYLESN